MPLACQLNESHFQNTTKTLPITRKPSTLARVRRALRLLQALPPSLTRLMWCRSAQCGPRGRWRTSSLFAGTDDGTPDTPCSQEAPRRLIDHTMP